MTETATNKTLLGGISMKVSFEKNQYFLTKVTGYNLDEIRAYCSENNLDIVEETGRMRQGALCYTVWAEKPNQRMRVLRKKISKIEGWELINVERTPKMYWLTYEKKAKSVV